MSSDIARLARCPSRPGSRLALARPVHGHRGRPGSASVLVLTLSNTGIAAPVAERAETLLNEGGRHPARGRHRSLQVTNRKHMTGDHHSQATGVATLLVRAVDVIVE
jgi:hypothetical protein